MIGSWSPRLSRRQQERRRLPAERRMRAFWKRQGQSPGTWAVACVRIAQSLHPGGTNDLSGGW